MWLMNLLDTLQNNVDYILQTTQHICDEHDKKLFSEVLHTEPK